MPVSPPRERFPPPDPPHLSIVVPTFCEVANIDPTIEALERALAGIRWELVFVDDDSPDGTGQKVRARGRHDGRIRLIRRVGRRGLAGAVIEGILASAADIVAVLDCDLQHDETQLPRLVAAIDAGADLAIATRYTGQGDAKGGFGWLRRQASAAATRLTNLILHSDVSDPMSGFFAVRRSVVEEMADRLSTDGFKVLMDILASAPEPGLKIAEVAYTFRPRQHGTSKLDGLVIADYLGLLISKIAGNRVSPRFFLFALVGASGLIVHLWTLRTTLDLTHLTFGEAQLVAAFVAMTSNFVFNNALTFRDRRLSGWAALKGLLSFYAVCSVGTLANVGVADLIFRTDASWWRAGIAGALMAAVFNYAASSIFTWRR